MIKKIVSIGIGLALSSPLAGQAAETEEGKLVEIIVTAQRREQNLQEVPISVTAFSSEQLERSNIKGATDYLSLTPNVSFTEDAQSGSRSVNVAIRGVNNLVSGDNAFVNSVGNYLDGFSIASVPSGVANPMLIDMERVEVLRGPQGTYFGRNSLGGALNLTTRKPTDRYEGELSLGAESYEGADEMYNITGIFNAPVSDTFKLRGYAFYEDSTGLVENIGPGTDDSGHQWLNLRLRGTWDLSEATQFGFTVIYADEDQGTDENVPSGYLDIDSVDTFVFQPGTAFDPGTGFWPDNQNKLSHDLDEQNTLETVVAIGNLSHTISDALTFKGIAGVIDTAQDRVFDNDLIGNLDLLKRTNHYTGDSWSVEGRLESTSKAVDWIVGALYAQDRQGRSNSIAVSSDPTALLVRDGVTYGFFPPFPEGLGLSVSNTNYGIDSFAAFLDTTWHIRDQFDLIVGARYTSDDVRNQYASLGIRPSCDCGPASPAFFPSFINISRPPVDASTSFSDISPRAGIRYFWNDTHSAYATISKGYKAGGTSAGNDTNNNSAPIAISYKEEELWNYEVGIKTEFADRRVRFNASVFFMDWENLQVEAFRFLTPGDLSSNFNQAINVDSEARGIEIELLAAPADGLTIGGSLGYLDTEITDEPECDQTSFGPTCIQISGGFAVTAIGLEMPKAPKVTANAFGEYRWPIASKEAWVRAEYVHRDSMYSDIEALTNLQTRGPSPNQGLVRVVGPNEFPYKVPSFDVVNVRGGVEWQRAAVTLYVQNLFDEVYYTGTQENFGLSGIRLRPHPRTYGVNLSYKW